MFLQQFEQALLEFLVIAAGLIQPVIPSFGVWLIQSLQKDALLVHGMVSAQKANGSFRSQCEMRPGFPPRFFEILAFLFPELGGRFVVDGLQ